jgi:hypothetical protein
VRRAFAFLLCLIGLVGQVFAGFVNMSGFEDGGTLDQFQQVGTVSVQSSVSRSGSYALKVNPTAASGYITYRAYGTNGKDSGPSITNSYITFYFREDTLPAARGQICRASDTGFALKGMLKVNSSGQLELYNSASTLKATASGAFSSATWYRIDWLVPTTSSGTSTASIYSSAGTLVETLTANGANWGTTAAGSFDLGDISTNTEVFYFDDWSWRDDLFAGAGAILPMIPTGDSASNTGFTASAGNKWAAIDDIPSNADTDYITSSTSGAAYTATLSMTNIAGTINGVKAMMIVRDEGGSSALKLRIRSGGTNSDNATDADPGASYAALCRVLTTDPTDSGAWTTGKLAALEVGPLNDAAVTVRCTQALVMVHCTPAAGDGLPPSSLTTLGVGGGSSPYPDDAIDIRRRFHLL